MDGPAAPAFYLRSGLYLRANGVDVNTVADRVASFLSVHGEPVDRPVAGLEGSDFKNEGVIGVAVCAPAVSSTGTWVGVIDSCPKQLDWLPVLARYLHDRTRAEIFCYWTSTPHQNVGESFWLRDGAVAGKSGSWKKIVKEVESFPQPYVRIAHIGSVQPEPRTLTFQLDRESFVHYLEFGFAHPRPTLQHALAEGRVRVVGGSKKYGWLERVASAS